MLPTLVSLLLAAGDGGTAVRLALADAGVAVDAGTAPAPKPAPAPPDPALTAKLEELKKRVLEAEARAAEQGRQLDALSKRFDSLSEQLEAFKREVTERETERRDSERRQAEQKQRLESSTRQLISLDQQLASGATGGAVEQLRAAEATYTGAALQYVQAARTALANGDVANARRLLGLAVLETQLTRQ